MMRGLKAFLAANLGLLAFATPAALSIDTHKSAITASFKQMGVTVTNPFKQFSGAVMFDPAKPAAGSARIEVITASFDLGDDDYSAEARKPEWLSSAAHPKAVFVTTAIKAVDGQRFEASGTLTLKGRTVKLVLPVVVNRAALATSFDGSLALSRKAFAIGDTSWNEVLDDVVTVKFHIVQPH